MSRPHVLIIGAGSVLGTHLARLLARRKAFRLTIAEPNESRIVPLQHEVLGIDPETRCATLAIDRDAISADRLRAIDCELVVDCAGPFRGSGSKLINAAIGAPCHYLDLADARDFVATIHNFDVAARNAGVAVLCGAGLAPGISEAIVDHLTNRWRDVDSIDIAVFPGSRAPRGQSVVDSTLAWAGQPLRVFREGRWQRAPGWSGGRPVTVEGLPARRAWLAEYPDLDLLPRRYSPRIRAELVTGMELDMVNTFVGWSSWLVRLGLVRSADRLAGLSQLIGGMLNRVGTHAVGMQVEVAGRDSKGDPRVARWWMVARNADAPSVSVIAAAALVEALCNGHGPWPGARSAAGLVTLEQLKPWQAMLEMTTGQLGFKAERPLYRRVLGPAFDSMPDAIRRLHRGRPAVLGAGGALVTPATGRRARWFAKRLGFPTVGGQVPLAIVVESRNGVEHWTRYFDDTPLRSVVRAPVVRARGSSEPGLVEESFGPLQLVMRPLAQDDGVDLHLVSARLGWLPLTGALRPRVSAVERVDADGHHQYDFELSLPVFGRIVSFRSYLRV